MASRGWIRRDPVGGTYQDEDPRNGQYYSGSAPRISREGVRQQGTQMSPSGTNFNPTQTPGFNFGQQFGIAPPSVQLPDSAIQKWGGLAPNQDPFGSQDPAMLDADPNISRAGDRYGPGAAVYKETDTEMAIPGAGEPARNGFGVPTPLSGGPGAVNPPGTTDLVGPMTSGTDFDAPLQSDFSEFDGIMGGRMGDALSGAQQNIIDGRTDLNPAPAPEVAPPTPQVDPSQWSQAYRVEMGLGASRPGMSWQEAMWGGQALQ